jgi:protein-disulfide isomerase
MVEFGDFECVYTAKVGAAISQLELDYGPEKLRVVWKHSPLPFHRHAMAASEAAQGVMALAGPEAFWHFHDLVLQNYATLGRDRYVYWASQVGIHDIAAYATGIAGHTWAPAVEHDMEQGKAAGVVGTPTFFVNAVRMVGAYELRAFKTVIDRELAAVAAKSAAHTPRAGVYAERSASTRLVDDLPRERIADNDQLAAVAAQAADPTAASTGREGAALR